MDDVRTLVSLKLQHSTKRWERLLWKALKSLCYHSHVPKSVMTFIGPHQPSSKMRKSSTFVEVGRGLLLETLSPELRPTFGDQYPCDSRVETKSLIARCPLSYLVRKPCMGSYLSCIANAWHLTYGITGTRFFSEILASSTKSSILVIKILCRYDERMNNTYVGVLGNKNE